jgi:hypothetical protein
MARQLLEMSNPIRTATTAERVIEYHMSACHTTLTQGIGPLTIAQFVLPPYPSLRKRSKEKESKESAILANANAFCAASCVNED